MDFFEVVFQTVYTNIYKGYRPERLHQTTLVLNGAQRLYQLLKNIVLMSLIRQRKAAVTDSISRVYLKPLLRPACGENPEDHSAYIWIP